MKFRCSHAVCLLALLFAAQASTAQTSWPRFRGPNGDGICDAKTIPVTWTEKDYNWKADLPSDGYSSPVVWGRRIYLTCGDVKTAERSVLCLNTTDGRVLWRKKFSSSTYRQHRDNNYASATPTADADGVVVAWSTPGSVILLALDTDGREQWRRDLGPYVGIHGSGASPIIVGDQVILANDQMDPKRMARFLPRGKLGPPGESFLVSVDRKTGKTRWKTSRRTSLAAYSTPCVRPVQGGGRELIVTSTAEGIAAVNLADGKVNWSIDDVFKDRCVGSPVLAPGLVIAGYGYGTKGTRYIAVRPDRKDHAAPEIVYDVKKSVPLVPTPVVKDGRLFLWGDAGIATCLEVSTGREIWRERVNGKYYGSPVWVDGRLYCIARNGEVVVIAASDTFKILSRVALGEASYTTPAVANGVMYLRTNTRLYSLGVPNDEARYFASKTFMAFLKSLSRTCMM